MKLKIELTKIVRELDLRIKTFENAHDPRLSTLIALKFNLQLLLKTLKEKQK